MGESTHRKAHSGTAGKHYGGTAVNKIRFLQLSPIKRKNQDNWIQFSPDPGSILCTFCLGKVSCRTVRSKTKLMNILIERGKAVEALLIFDSMVKEVFFDNQDASSTIFNVVMSSDTHLIQDVIAEKIPNCLAQLWRRIMQRAVIPILRHTLGRKSLAQVRDQLKKRNPKLGSPSAAKIYLKSRKRKPGRKYKSNTDIVQKRMDGIKEMMNEGQMQTYCFPMASLMEQIGWWEGKVLPRQQLLLFQSFMLCS